PTKRPSRCGRACQSSSSSQLSRYIRGVPCIDCATCNAREGPGTSWHQLAGMTAKVSQREAVRRNAHYIGVIILRAKGGRQLAKKVVGSAPRTVFGILNHGRRKWSARRTLRQPNTQPPTAREISCGVKSTFV